MSEGPPPSGPEGTQIPALLRAALRSTRWVALLAGVGAAAGALVRRLRASEQALQEQVRQQAAMAELGRQALAELELDELVQVAVTLVCDTCAIEACELLELTPEGGGLVLRAAAGGRSQPGERTATADGSLAGYTIATGEPVVVRDLATEPRFRDQHLLERGVVSAMSAIVRGRTGPFGVVTALATRRRSFTGHDVTFLRGIANTLGEALGQKRAEDERRGSEQQLARLVEASPLAIIAADRRSTVGNVTLWNPAAERLFGWSAEEVLGRPNPIVPPGEVARVRDLRERIMAGEEVVGVEAQRLCKDGSVVDVALSFALLRDAAGAVEGTIAFFEDIGARKRFEEQLRHAQKMEAVGQLAGGVAHDFNNVLTAILAYAEFALGGLEGDAPVRTELDGIRAAAERAAGLTRQLLAIGRGRLVQAKPVDLSELVRGTLELARRTLGEEIELVPRLADDLIVCVDPAEIEQVFLNLAINARDAMPGGGILCVSTEPAALETGHEGWHLDLEPGDYAVLAVTDTGTGMDEETRRRAFEPFFTTKPETHGSGLGLSTVYGIVRQVGGTVWLYSEPGLGTTAKVYLPRVAAPVTEQRASLAGPAAATRGSGTLLLVEDDDLLRGLIETILLDRGYRVVVAAGPEEAIERFRQRRHEIDLLISDIVMPAMRGSELARRLRALAPALPVVFMSGYAGDAIELGDLGAESCFVEKPFSPDALAQAVAKSLRARAPRAADR